MLCFSETNNYIKHSANQGCGSIIAYYTLLSFSGTRNLINNIPAEYGGAICTIYNTVLSFSGTSNFINNSASYGGGAIITDTNNTLTFSGTIDFISNSCNGRTDTLYLFGDKIHFLCFAYITQLCIGRRIMQVWEELSMFILLAL